MLYISKLSHRALAITNSMCVHWTNTSLVYGSKYCNAESLRIYTFHQACQKSCSKIP